MKKLLFVGITVLVLGACSTEGALQRLLGINAAAPVFYGCKIPAEGEVDFLFSSGVKVLSMYFDPLMETAEVVSQGETVAIRFDSSLPGGSRVTADLLVEDKDKNTLNVLVNFRTRNDRIPNFVINEIRSEYSKPKVEFIELKMLGPGNLGALRLFSASGKEEALFEFPPVEVKAGEYVVLHTRSIEEGIEDETGSDLWASGGTDSSGGRDFWLPGSVKLLHSTNAIYAMDQDEKVLDGVVLVNSNKWPDAVAVAAELLAGQGAWTGTSSDEAFDSEGTTATRTICRTSGADTNNAANWYVTVTSGATPGRANNPSRYK